MTSPSTRQPTRPVKPSLTAVIATVACVCALSAFALTAGGGAAIAQSQNLIDRVERLQKELSTLQRHVYGGGTQAGAAAAVGEGGAKPLGARVELRMSQLESQVRTLTGDVEQVGFQINQLSQRLDKLVADVDWRLQRLEQGGVPLAEGGEAPTGTTAAGQTSQPAQTAAQASQAPAASAATGQTQAAPQQGTQPQTFDTGPKVLGTVRASDVEAIRSVPTQQSGTAQAGAAQTGAAQGQTAPAATTQSGTAQVASTGTATTATQSTALAGASAKAQYDYAFGLLSQANYAEAEQALITFLDKHPRDPLAGNAKYWLGETHYVRGQYRDAAITFAEGYQQYPSSPKAPDNLLKLGKSLAALGQSADACGTYAELIKRYPNAPAAVLQQAGVEQNRLSC